MVVLILILLIWAAVAGVLWPILQIALGVALGVFLAGVMIILAGYLVIRSKIRQMQRDRDRRLRDPDRYGRA